ncbi:MAG: hypothetical protein IT331_10940 [Anaerolineae bacterium]|nr:hypothetical protein [Anaerolineae bacterium]
MRKSPVVTSRKRQAIEIQQQEDRAPGLSRPLRTVTPRYNVRTNGGRAETLQHNVRYRAGDPINGGDEKCRKTWAHYINSAQQRQKSGWLRRLL